MYSFSDCYKVPKDSDLRKFGIYCIENKVNGRQYIGSTTRSFRDRLQNHLYHLKKGTHHSMILQRAFNKYGVDCFSIELIEFVYVKDSKTVQTREQHYLDTLNPEYNILPNAESFSGHKHSEERRKRQVSVLRTKFSTRDCGVKYIPTYDRWGVHISVTDFKINNLGFFKTKDEALIARKQAEAVFWTEEFDALPVEEKKRTAERYKKSIVRADCTSGYRYISISSARIGGKCWKFFYKRKLIQSFYTLEEAVAFRDEYLQKNNLI